jgi:hypothetical protein
VGFASAPKPVDRLAPGELEQGADRAFGLVLPKGLKVIRRFTDSVHAVGRVRPEDVANYVRHRVKVHRVELGAARTIFPDVKITEGDPHRVYRIEVISAGPGSTKLEFYDVTPAPKIEGLSEAERWRRAGFKPDGTPLHPEKLE